MEQILFNTKMVQAILAARKTQTRRPIKAPGNEYHYDRLLGDWPLSGQPKIIEKKLHWELQKAVDDNGLFIANLPYQKGDILYARETWKVIVADPTVNFLYIKYIADKRESYVEFARDRFEKFKKYYDKKGWQPNIFMPKEAAMLFIEVTDIRVERVQDISYEGAIAEGITETEIYNELLDECSSVGAGTGTLPVQAFADLWHNLYKTKGYGWDDNPWIWVIEFERCEKPDEN